MIYHFDFDYDPAIGKAAFLNLGAYSAVHVEVLVNGAVAGTIPWRAAKELDISAHLKSGKNSIDLEVVGSPRNLFGPLHEAMTNHPFTFWESFRRTGAKHTEGYVVKPYGLFSQIDVYSE
jgi:hypothetical protein